MFTTLDQFFNDYCVKNNQQPNETVLNRSALRLKRELRELKSKQDVSFGIDIEEWNANKLYEIDEYVQYNGLVYKSNVDQNYSIKPTSTNGNWVLSDIPVIQKSNQTFKTVSYIANDQQREFYTNYRLDNAPCVFKNGILVHSTDFTYTTNKVILNSPVNQGTRVTIILGISYSTAELLPKRQLVATEDQYNFDVPFTLSSPVVFVDGILQNEDSYNYQKQQVQFYEPIKKDSVVTICNGAQVGIDVYNKSEVDNKFNDYYTKTENYSKTETDNLITNTKTEILNDTTLAKAGQSYTKTEIDDTLTNYVRNKDLTTALSTKADRTNSLQGYGIIDAYTMSDVDIKLNKKLDASRFTTPEILKLLENAHGEGSGINADTLKGITPEQLMRADRETDNVGGIQTRDQGVTSTISLHPNVSDPKIELTRKVDANYTREYKAFTGLNCNGLIFQSEGNFKGTWWNDIHVFGVANPNDYNWVVEVHLLGTGNQFDFVPKNYGEGFEFKAFKQSGYNGAYCYGFVDNNVVKMYAYVRNSDSGFLETYAHYTLTGIHKSLGTKVNFNQGDELENGTFQQPDYLRFNTYTNTEHSSNVSSVGTIEDITEPSVTDDNALSIQSSDVTVEDSTNKYARVDGVTFSQPTYKLSSSKMNKNSNLKIYLMNELFGTSFGVQVQGDGQLVQADPMFSTFNEATIEIQPKAPFTSTVTVTVTSEDFRPLTIEIPY